LIVVNGCQKSGTHAVCALLDTLGLKRCPGTILPLGDQLYVSGSPLMSIDALRTLPDNCYILAHAPARYSLDGFRAITIKRDPRNVLVSYCRHRKREGSKLEFTIPSALTDFWGAPFVSTYRSYLGWAGRSIIIRYEDMPASVIGDGSGIYERHNKDWNTRTGKPSRWQDVWNEQAEAAWVRHGGPELAAQAGYS
jgi:hypothetical protein